MYSKQGIVILVPSDIYGKSFVLLKFQRYTVWVLFVFLGIRDCHGVLTRGNIPSARFARGQSSYVIIVKVNVGDTIIYIYAQARGPRYLLGISRIRVLILPFAFAAATTPSND